MAWEQGENAQYSGFNGTDLSTMNSSGNMADIALNNSPEARGLKFRLRLRIALIIIAVMFIVGFLIILNFFEEMVLFIGIPIFFAAFGMFLAFFVLSLTNRGYFKDKVVRAALAKHLDISFLSLNTQHFMGVENLLGILMGAPKVNNDYSKHDLMLAPCDKDLIDYLEIYVQGWNKGAFNDEIRGSYNGTEFRFLDIILYYEYRTSNNRYEREKKYGGQVYMFRMSEPIPIGIVYEVVPGEDYTKPELFSKAFKARPAIIDPNMTEEIFAEVRKVIETPMMIETMMRLAEIWRGAIWKLSVVDDIMVFNLNREFVDMFEIQDNKFELTMAQLNTDVNEFVEVIQKASSIDSLH